MFTDEGNDSLPGLDDLIATVVQYMAAMRLYLFDIHLLFN